METLRRLRRGPGNSLRKVAGRGEKCDVAKINVTFGEIMLRLAPPGHERFLQSPRFEATFGGGEANVATALSLFGLPAAFVTVLPDKNPIADAAISEIRRFGVDTSRIARGKGR